MNRFRFYILAFSIFLSFSSYAHDILFCGERIPVSNDFVAARLMNVIRRQIPNVNLPQLRKRAQENFPIVEYYLRETHLPEDFKYLAIVESGFLNVTSKVGARGFWQLMPNTAKELGLEVSYSLDERDNIYKSTYAACKVLASYYLEIKKVYGISSWVLTAAAYNVGIGRMLKAINKQGNDYFSMNLNPETAAYVYKIIAVKELFEYPELYMKDFGYNVFTTIRQNVPMDINTANSDTDIFNSMTVQVSESDGQHPHDVTVTEVTKPVNLTNQPKRAESSANVSIKYVAATIKGKYKNFNDGEPISIEINEDLQVKGTYNSRGNILLGKGWIIDDRIYVDLGYNDHEVVLLDVSGNKGIALNELKKNEPVLLRIQSEEQQQ
jgi:hypothetical protein